MNYHRRKISLASTAIALMATITASAVPANPRLQPVVQPDGSTIMARLTGDEHGHFVITENGLPIERGADGLFHYYMIDSEGTPYLSDLRVNPAGMQSAEERSFIASAEHGRLREALIRQTEGLDRKRSRRNLPPQASGFPSTGSPRGLVLLIEYSDVHFTVADANNAFSRMLNEKGYSDFGGWGSARDWFIDNSCGAFSPQFDVVGPIRLSHPRSYYGGNNSGGDDLRPEMMIIESCGLIDDEVDFSLYDEDGDGYIDNIFAFYAGYGENLGVGAPSECVWPHSWDIAEVTSVPYYFDGKRLNHYACTNEIDLSDMMDGIGTFIHEFSHVMGLPDLYATNYSFAFTPGSWSVMDEGPYNNNSRTPPLYSAFERLSLGWLDPLKIDRAANLKIPAISQNRAYYIPTELENEYFLFENRQQEGWDTFLPYHGMLVWHIDYNENIWRYNTVNDRKNHQYVDIIEADNHQHSDTRESDCFPGKSNVTEFTDNTTPAMRSWAGIGCGMPLTDIYESNGYIYLKVLGGKTTIEPTQALEPTSVGVDRFTANWMPAEEETYESILSVYSATTLSNGQMSISYVAGYESLNLGAGVSSAIVEGLTPGVEYRYSVRIKDPESALESVASNEIVVTLQTPTFDYFSPKAIAATDITETGFTAYWEPLEGADEYTVTVCRKEIGPAEKTECGFDGGLSSLPDLWTTNSKLTYAAADYCGNAMPSLRFNTEGHYLEMTAPEGYARGISFWMRGVGTTDKSYLETRALISGEWISCVETPVTKEASGTEVSIDDTRIPYGAEAVRLIFHPGDKGSVAIDDVTLLWGGDTEVIPLPDHTALSAGRLCSLEVTGLEASTTYFYTVTAYSEGVRSKVSNEIAVTTAKSDAIGITEAARVIWNYDRTEAVLRMEGLKAGTMVSATTVDGATILSAKADENGAASLKLLPGRVWIVTAPYFNLKLK